MILNAHIIGRPKGEVIVSQHYGCLDDSVPREGLNRRQFHNYRKFIDFLRNQGVEMRSATGGHPMKDRSGKLLETYTVRVDSKFVTLARSFTLSD